MERATRKKITQRHKPVSRGLHSPRLILNKVAIDSKLIDRFLKQHAGSCRLLSPDKRSPLHKDKGPSAHNDEGAMARRVKTKCSTKSTPMEASYNFSRFLSERFSSAKQSKDTPSSEEEEMSISLSSQGSICKRRAIKRKALGSKNNPQKESLDIQSERTEVTSNAKEKLLKESDLNEEFRQLEQEAEEVLLATRSSLISKVKALSQSPKVKSKYSQFLEDDCVTLSPRHKKAKRRLLDSSSDEEGDGAMMATPLPQFSSKTSTAANKQPRILTNSASNKSSPENGESHEASIISSPEHRQTRKLKKRPDVRPAKDTATRNLNKDEQVSVVESRSALPEKLLPDCLIDPTSFIGPYTSAISPSTPIIGPPVSLVSPSPLVDPSSDFDGLMDWFDFEQCTDIDIDLLLVASEPEIAGGPTCRENDVSVIQNHSFMLNSSKKVTVSEQLVVDSCLEPSATHQSEQNMKSIVCPVSKSAGAQSPLIKSPEIRAIRKSSVLTKVVNSGSKKLVIVNSGNRKLKIVNSGKKKLVTMPSSHSRESTVETQGKRPRGRPKGALNKKTLAKIKGTNNRSLDKKKTLKTIAAKSLPISPSAIKKEPLDFSPDPTPRKRPSPVSKQSTKKVKVPKRSRNNKATASLIAGVFDKLAQDDKQKQLNINTGGNSAHQTNVEDSGYTTSISGSDSSSRSSRVPASRSPVESVMSPVLLDYPPPELANFSVEEGGQHVLLEDPILQGSNVSESIPSQAQDITVSVLESGLSDVSHSNVLDLIPTTNQLEGVTGNTDLATVGNVTDSELIFPELDVLLNSSHLFNPNEMVILKTGDICGTQEIASFEDGEDILKSDTVTDCLKELQQSGRIGGEVISGPVIDVTTEVTITTDCDQSDSELGKKNQDGVQKISSSSAAAIEKTGASRIKSGIPFSMVHSKTKSGRICKPTTRLMKSDFLHGTVLSASELSSQKKRELSKKRSPHSAVGSQQPTAGKYTDVSLSKVLTVVETPKNKTPERSKPVIPRVRAPSPVAGVSSVYTPGTTIVCHSPRSPFAIKLRDFNVNISRSPISRHKVTNFKFKLPESPPRSLRQKVGVATNTVPKSTTKFSFSLEDKISVPHSVNERVVTVQNETPPHTRPSVSEREVRYKEPGERSPGKTTTSIAQSPFLTSTSAVIHESPPAVCPGNSLNMSLDKILREIEVGKQSVKSTHEQASSSREKGGRSCDQRVVKIQSSDRKLPILDRLEPKSKTKRVVKFADSYPACDGDFDGSLTDNDISELLFSPLDIDSSLDQVLQGESLFGGRLEKVNLDDSSLVKEKSKSSKMLRKLHPVKSGQSEDKSTSLLLHSPKKSSQDLAKLKVSKSVSLPKVTSLEHTIKPAVPKTSSEQLEDIFDLTEGRDTKPAVLNQVSNSPPAGTRKSTKKAVPSPASPKTNLSILEGQSSPRLQIVKSPKKSERMGIKCLPKEEVPFSFKLTPITPNKDSHSSPISEGSKDAGKEESSFGQTASQLPPKKDAFTEPQEEDVIDLYADDTDMFETETKDSPLSTLFKKPLSPTQKNSTKATSSQHGNREPMVTGPPLTKKISNESGENLTKRSFSSKFPPSLPPWNSRRRQISKTPFQRNTHGNSPGPASEGGSSPGYDFPPQVMPYKKQQVSQWVAEQQRRAGYGPPIPHPLSSTHHKMSPYDHLPSVPFRSNCNGNSSNESFMGNGNGGHFHFEDTQPLPPPPTHQLQLSFANEPTQGSQPNYGQEAFGSGGSVLEGFCRSFLRGSCEYDHCRFKHAPVSTVPVHVLEAALFPRGTPVEHCSVDVLCRYSDDIQSCRHLQANLKKFADLIRSLSNKNYSAVATGYSFFCHSVKFNHAFLCRVLELCSNQSPSCPGPLQPLALAEKVFSEMFLHQGVVGRDVYYFYLKTLANCDATVRMIEVYEAMRTSGNPPNLDIVLLMLRVGKALEHRVFDLLDDLKFCSPPLLDIQEARCVNRLIDIADSTFLLKHITKLVSWLEQAPETVIQKLTLESFRKVINTLSQHHQWGPVIVLLDSCPNHLLSIENSILCGFINSVVKATGPTEKTVSVLGRLNEEQQAGISSEVWNCVITDCAEKARVVKASQFCRVASRHKKQLSIETSSSLMALFLSQQEHSSAITLLKKSLEHNPSALPSLPLLTSLCEAMDSPHDVQLVIRTLLFTNTTPTPVILQCLLNTHSKHKVYSKLAEVVKLSLDYNQLLDKLFYQKVLIELRHWGKDQDAISSVYKALRKVEKLGDANNCVKVEWDSIRTDGLSGMSVLSGVKSDPLDTSVDLSSATFKGLAKPQPLFASAPPPTTGGDNSRGVSDDGKRGVASLSLENVFKQSASQDQSSLLNLIEVNGCQGQFGAVASILVSLSGAHSHYDNQTVHAVWRAITKSRLRIANAFSNILSCLNQSRSAVGKSPTSPPSISNSSLLVSDRWLVSQVGIALLKMCETNEDWQSGFVILHHLHRFGVHYVKLSQPSSNLPSCMPVPPTPCMVAMMAINVCLHIDQVSGALEVLQGCEWIQPSSTDELNVRTKFLVEITKKCLQLKQHQDAWKCLEAIDSGTIMKKFIHIVTNLHNKLLQNLLSSKDVSFALCVYHTMRGNKLQCLPSYFSCLLQNLSGNNQESLARDLCKSAIADSCYCALTRDNLFRVTLPVGLVRIELHLLLEDHLEKVAVNVDKDKLQPLQIQFNAGSRFNLELIFSSDFDPPLSVEFAVKGSLATIPLNSLRAWCDKHSTDKPPSENTNSPPVTPRQIHTPVSPMSCAIKSPPLVLGPSHNITSTSHSDLPKVTASSDVVKTPPPVVTTELRHVEPDIAVKSPIKRQVKLRLKRRISEVEKPSEHVSPPVAKKVKLDKKQFKQDVCRMFIEELKPHYQTGKFKSSADYTHLLRVLSLNYFKTCRSKDRSVASEDMKKDIASIVASLMSKVHVYSIDIDSDLGLTCSSSDSV